MSRPPLPPLTLDCRPITEAPRPSPWPAGRRPDDRADPCEAGL